MSKSNRPERIIQKLTGWKYTKALQFVRDNQDTADVFASEDGCTPKEALIRMAQAEIDGL